MNRVIAAQSGVPTPETLLTVGIAEVLGNKPSSCRRRRGRTVVQLVKKKLIERNRGMELNPLCQDPLFEISHG